jgi:CMP-N,N'-diacetyllegionaminic acid synthase
MKILYLIPARGGSKGIPYKNIKPFNGKPLIRYTIDVARKLSDDSNICVSSDDDDIINNVETYGLKVQFRRPVELATDQAGSYEVIMHALDYYESKGITYEILVLLQPTSPFRNADHIKESLEIFAEEIDMVVSVKESTANPYYDIFEDNARGFLEKSKEGEYFRRQDCPSVWQYNGAVYVMNVKSLKKMHFSHFLNIKKYVMDRLHSIDLDNQLDWQWAEFLLEKGHISI